MKVATFVLGHDKLACFRPTFLLRKARKAGENTHVTTHIQTPVWLQQKATSIAGTEEAKIPKEERNWGEANILHPFSLPGICQLLTDTRRKSWEANHKMEAQVLKHKAEFLAETQCWRVHKLEFRVFQGEGALVTTTVVSD